MTESFPFTPDDALAPDDEGSAPGSSRRLLLAGGLLAVVVLGAGGALLLGGDDEEEVFVAPVAAAPRAVATPTPATTPGALPAPFDEALGRDPFRALYVQPAAAPAAATSPTDPTLPSAAPAAEPAPIAVAPAAGLPDVGQPDEVVPDAGVPAAGPDAPQGPTAQEHALVLRRVFGSGADQTAEFTIDGRKTLAKVGARFGPTDEIRLISLQEGPAAAQWTAVLQVGDGEPFDAVTGDEVSVR